MLALFFYHFYRLSAAVGESMDVPALREGVGYKGVYLRRHKLAGIYDGYARRIWGYHLGTYTAKAFAKWYALHG